MTGQPHNAQNLDLPTALPSASSPSGEEREKFEPKAYFYGAWHLIKSDLFVFLWKLGADLVRAGLSIATIAMIAVVMMTGVASSMSAPKGPIFGLETFVQKLATPAYIIGVAGVLFCAWLIGIMIDVLVLSGVWGMLATGARGEPIERFRTFFANVTTHLPEVLSLRITTLAAQAIVVLLGLTAVVSITVATTGGSGFSDASIWARGLMWAVPLTLLAGLSVLIRLTMELAAAPMMLEGRSLGDSILTAAKLVTQRFSEIYRLLVVAASLLLVPLFLLWGVLIFGSLTMDVAALAPINALIRLGSEAVLFAATGAIAILFYGAVFLYYAHEMAMIDGMPGQDDDIGTSANQDRSDSSGRVDFDEDTTLDELLPDEYPNIIALDDVLGVPGSKLGPEPDLDPKTKPDDGLSGDDVFDDDDPSH
jgi:hypothetical protein